MWILEAGIHQAKRAALAWAQDPLLVLQRVPSFLLGEQSCAVHTLGLPCHPEQTINSSCLYQDQKH